MRIPTRAASSLVIAALLVAVATALTAAPAQAAAARSCLPASLQAAPAHAASASRVAPVYFEMRTIENAPFVFQLTDPRKIEHARRILSGEEQDEVHVIGRIVKRPAPYNPRWSFHYDPNTIDFFSNAFEVCDATVSYVEEHLDEACGAFLPGCVFCPWTSRLVREVTPA